MGVILLEVEVLLVVGCFVTVVAFVIDFVVDFDVVAFVAASVVNVVVIVVVADFFVVVVAVVAVVPFAFATISLIWRIKSVADGNNRGYGLGLGNSPFSSWYLWHMLVMRITVAMNTYLVHYWVSQRSIYIFDGWIQSCEFSFNQRLITHQMSVDS